MGHYPQAPSQLQNQKGPINNNLLPSQEVNPSRKVFLFSLNCLRKYLFRPKRSIKLIGDKKFRFGSGGSASTLMWFPSIKSSSK